MLSLARALVLGSVFVSACGAPASQGKAVRASADSELPAPTLAPPASVVATASQVVVHGAVATMILPRGKGSLEISFEAQGREGSGKVTASYVRKSGCAVEPGATGGVVVCPVQWEEKHVLPTSRVTFDPLLASATLNDRLRGQVLSVTWAAVAQTERRANENGYLLFESRESTSRSRWGRDAYAQPRDDQVLSLVFRRVSEP